MSATLGVMSTADQSQALAPDALNRLVASREQFLAFLRKRLNSPEVAEDILQAAFVKSMEKGGAVRGEETIVAWFYRLPSAIAKGKVSPRKVRGSQ